MSSNLPNPSEFEPPKKRGFRIYLWVTTGITLALALGAVLLFSSVGGKETGRMNTTVTALPTVGTVAPALAAPAPATAAVATPSTSPTLLPVPVVPESQVGPAVNVGLLAADTGAGRVVELTPENKWRVVADGLNRPYGVAAGPDGLTFVSDSNNSSVYRVFKDGSKVAVGSNFDTPCGLAVAPSGDLYVADAGHGSVQKVTPSGQQTVVRSGLSGAQDVALDPSGTTLYIADTYAQVVRSIDLRNGSERTVGSALYRPDGVAVDVHGFLYVSDFQGVYRISPSGSQASLGTGLSNPSGVAVDFDGNVYIADYGNNRVVKVLAGSTSQVVIGTGLNPFAVALR